MLSLKLVTLNTLSGSFLLIFLLVYCFIYIYVLPQLLGTNWLYHYYLCKLYSLLYRTKTKKLANFTKGLALISINQSETSSFLLNLPSINLELLLANDPLIFYLYLILSSLCMIVFVLICVAYFTLAERNILGLVQRREGPNVVGFWGILQPFADGLKLFKKEIIVPTKSQPVVFLVTPILTFFFSLLSWIILPFSFSTFFIFDTNLSLLYLFIISALGVYGVTLSGWSGGSVYSILGAYRVVSLMLSYDILIGTIFATFTLLVGSLRLSDLILMQQKTGWFLFPYLPLAYILFVATLVETNRTPFDLAEAESELVAGYNVEYSGVLFALFFLAEYGSMLIMGNAYSNLVLAGPDLFLAGLDGALMRLIFCFKVVFFAFLFVIVRAKQPRYKFNNLMTTCWLVFFPVCLAYFFFSFQFVVSFY